MVVGARVAKPRRRATIALVHEGDLITIDATKGAATAARRRGRAGQAPCRFGNRRSSRYRRGVLAKFAFNASSASTGVVDRYEDPAPFGPG